MATTELVHRIVAQFKDLLPRLKEAAEREDGPWTQAMFEAEGHLVSAHYNAQDKFFFKLVASPMTDPPPGEPAVVYEITPPADEQWG